MAGLGELVLTLQRNKSRLHADGRLLNIAAMRLIISFATIGCAMGSLVASAQTNAPSPSVNSGRITSETVAEAEKIIGLSFADTNLTALANGLRAQLRTLRQIRAYPLSNSVPSALLFNPLPVGFQFETVREPIQLSVLPDVKLPANMDDLAFYSVEELGVLIRTRQLTSEKLTRFYLDRLKKYGPSCAAW